MMNIITITPLEERATRIKRKIVFLVFNTRNLLLMLFTIMYSARV